MIRYMTAAAIVALAFAAPSAAQQVRFEDPKPDVARQEEGVKLDFGAAFTQTFQSLGHSNTALEVLDPNGSNRNALADIGAGFNLASANVALNARLAPGINVVLETYLSSRHHNDAWVKGGYLQMDASPLKAPLLETIMRYTTVKVGHYEVNYGDAHYRRSDNANGIANPFAENLILDAFTTEIGGEVIVRKGALLGVFGVTSGQNNGTVTNPDDRSLAFLGKVGFDKPFGSDARVRLTASTYQNDNAGRATLYWGDRAGGAYWGVLDNGDQAQHWNGRVNPNFTESIRAYQVNPFVELGPVELFGVIERARGRTLQESEDREVRQYALDAVYRLWEDRVYVAGRYNTVSGELVSRDAEQTVDRAVVSAGWFVTPNVLLKGEYVKQNYDGFAATSILNGGTFDGLVVQGVVGF
jgi:hypothetical protein